MRQKFDAFDDGQRLATEKHLKVSTLPQINDYQNFLDDAFSQTK